MNKYIFAFVFFSVLRHSSFSAQTKYIGGTITLNYSSLKNNSGFQNTSNYSSSFLLLPEFGISKENGSMFGVNFGINLSKERFSGNTSFFVAGVIGMRYRKLFGEKMFQPMFETGLTATIGQYNPGQQGPEYFNSSVPIRGGVLYNLNSKWNIIGSLDVFQLSYTRSGGTTGFNVNLWNKSGVSFSVIRRLN